MLKIEIDFDVWKELTLRLENEQDTYSAVIRRILRLPNAPKKINPGKSWITGGVEFPEGTEFRAMYKKRYYYAKVEAGALVIDGQRFYSPSKAARHITNNSVNGWIFWECKIPEQDSYQVISLLREKK